MACHNPLHCILPPRVLENIAKNGDEGQRAWAARALNEDQSIRLARVQNAMVRAGGPREGGDALAVQTVPRPNRVIRDAESTDNVKGDIVRRENDPDTGDKAVDEAYDGLGDTFRFFREIYSRDSIDDAGMPLRGVVHFLHSWPNAAWDGKRMLFGDGDGEIVGRTTRSLDVIGHELGHGVTEDEAALEYFGQSGALNESMSDVFGSLVKQYKLGQTADQANWLIGKEIWTPEIKQDALRSMKAPGTAYDHPLIGKDPQPAHMDKYVETLDDFGGVHINSGIPNHAFYLFATSLGGNAWERPGRIWYRTLVHPELKKKSSFRRFVRLSLDVAERIFGKPSDEHDKLKQAWADVGL